MHYRINQSATYLSEGDGHHELAAYSTVSGVQRRGPCANGEIQLKAKDSG
jgi:hypothetical protein